MALGDDSSVRWGAPPSPFSTWGLELAVNSPRIPDHLSRRWWAQRLSVTPFPGSRTPAPLPTVTTHTALDPSRGLSKCETTRCWRLHQVSSPTGPMPHQNPNTQAPAWNPLLAESSHFPADSFPLTLVGRGLGAESCPPPSVTPFSSQAACHHSPVLLTFQKHLHCLMWSRS